MVSGASMPPRFQAFRYSILPRVLELGAIETATSGLLSNGVQ
jgi:hypothetical protein